jgi:arginine deiminase
VRLNPLYGPARQDGIRVGAAERVVVAGVPKLRAAMHLDTVFTFAERDIGTLFATIVDAVHAFALCPADTSPAVDY